MRPRIFGSVTHSLTLCHRLKDSVLILKRNHLSGFTDSRREFRQALGNAFRKPCKTFCLYQTAKSFVLSVNRHFFDKLELKKLKSQLLNFQLHDHAIDHAVSRTKHTRNSYTRHLRRGKWPFYHSKLHWVRASDISQGRFLVVNFHGQVKKIRRSAHDILRGKLEGCFDVRGTRANHDTDEVVIKFPANDMRDISYYLSNLRNLWPLVKDGAY